MIFKNKYDEVRSGYKILLAILFMLIVGTIAISILMMVVGIIYAVVNSSGGEIDIYELEAFLSGEVGLLLSTSISNIVCIGGCILLWKLFEKKKISEMGLINIKKGYIDLILGLIMGAVAISIVAAILLLTGTVKLEGSITNPNISPSLFWGLILFITVGFGEEILGRGYIMSVLKQTRNKWVIIIISSLIFAALHLGNNGISLIAFVNLALVGSLFAYMFMKSKNIWMPIGYHITWNYFQGYVWGFGVSGIDINGIYTIKNVNDNVINGGAFGPEGGLIVTLITCLLFFVVHFYYRKSRIEEFIDIIDNKEIMA